MKRSLALISMAILMASGARAQQQNNVIINNNNWNVMVPEAQRAPNIVFQTSFQTSFGNDFTSQWIGNGEFFLWVGGERSQFILEAYVVTQADMQRQSRGTALFSLPRNTQAAAQMLNTSGWKYFYSSGGYNMTLIIESIWMDEHYVLRCKGRMVVTA
jgi:hypothetical protein